MGREAGDKRKREREEKLTERQREERRKGVREGKNWLNSLMSHFD